MRGRWECWYLGGKGQLRSGVYATVGQVERGFVLAFCLIELFISTSLDAASKL